VTGSSPGGGGAASLHGGTAGMPPGLSGSLHGGPPGLNSSGHGRDTAHLGPGSYGAGGGPRGAGGPYSHSNSPVSGHAAGNSPR